MWITLRTFGWKLYREVDLLNETKDVLVAYLMLFATPEEIEFRVKNLKSLLSIHWEIERVLNVLPRELLLKIAKRVQERIDKESKVKVGKGPVKKASKKKASKKKTSKKLPI